MQIRSRYIIIINRRGRITVAYYADAVTDGVACSVGLPVSQSWALQNGWSDRDAVWVVRRVGPTKNY